MPFGVVLDACVLYPFSLRDTLLRTAEVELYDPYWSDGILDEVRRNLIAKAGVTAERAERLIDTMNEAFDGALLPQDPISRLEPQMTNEPKDRHVLAAAVSCGAQAIVTHNLADFPPEACDPFSIEALHPDDFLVDLYHLAPDLVREIVVQQAADLTSPPLELDELLRRLAVVVPKFVMAVRSD